MEKTKKWLGSNPIQCDICHKPFVDFFYDAKTKQGPWGLICGPCHKVHGMGLGTGKGQMYNLNTLEKEEG